MTYIILGSTGMLGHVLVDYLYHKGNEVISVSRRELPDYIKCSERVILDCKDTSKLTKLICDRNVDYIINCCGLLNTQCDERPYDALFINSYLPYFLSMTVSLNKLKTKIFQISTDCVFSGKIDSKLKYNDFDIKDAYSFYGISKGLGEIINNTCVTIRTSMVGSDINSNGIGLLSWFLEQNNEIKGYSDFYWTGVTSLELAKVIEYFSLNFEKLNLSKVYQVVPKDNISKYELLKIFNKYFRNNKISIVKDSSIKINKSLYNNIDELNYNIPSYEQMMSDLKDWVVEKEYYCEKYYNSL